MREITSIPELLCYMLGCLCFGYAIRGPWLPFFMDAASGVAFAVSGGFLIIGVVIHYIGLREMEQVQPEINPVPPPGVE